MTGGSQAEPNAVAAGSPAGPSRLMSLDVFRGATIAAMMLVNNPGDWKAVYPPLLHAEWHGWTPTDLVFPFFLWIVGVAVPLSTARRLELGAGRGELFRHILRRSALLFAIGLFLNLFGYLIDGDLFRQGIGAWLHTVATHLRIPGVLQRIAVCYFVGATVHLCFGPRGQATAIVLLLTGYWAAMMLVPVPGHGAGLLGKEANLAQFVDNLVFNGPTIGTHVWSAAKTWDPEGILSTLPAVATCLFGILTGQWLRTTASPERKTAWMLTAGCALLVLGQALSLWLPINKNLWTSSYAVFTAGMALVGFAAAYWLVDVRGWRRWAMPLAIYGMNALAVFVLSGMLGRLLLQVTVGRGDGAPVTAKAWLYQNLLGWVPDPRVASLGWALAWVAGLYAVAYALWRKKWFLKL